MDLEVPPSPLVDRNKAKGWLEPLISLQLTYHELSRQYSTSLKWHHTNKMAFPIYEVFQILEHIKMRFRKFLKSKLETFFIGTSSYVHTCTVTVSVVCPVSRVRSLVPLDPVRPRQRTQKSQVRYDYSKSWQVKKSFGGVAQSEGRL